MVPGFTSVKVLSAFSGSDRTDVVDDGDTAALVIVAGGEKVACQQDGEQHKRKMYIFHIISRYIEIMNVSLGLFTELIGYRFFVQQRVLDDVAFRIGHHDVVVGRFRHFRPVPANFLCLRGRVSPSFLAEVEVTVFVFHDEVYCVAAVLVLEVIQHVVGFPVIPRYHVIPVTILHRELYAAFANDVFEGYAFLAGDTVHGRAPGSMLPGRDHRSVLRCCPDKLRHRSGKHRPRRRM